MSIIFFVHCTIFFIVHDWNDCRILHNKASCMIHTCYYFFLTVTPLKNENMKNLKILLELSCLHCRNDICRMTVSTDNVLEFYLHICVLVC